MVHGTIVIVGGIFGLYEGWGTAKRSVNRISKKMYNMQQNLNFCIVASKIWSQSNLDYWNKNINIRKSKNKIVAHALINLLLWIINYIFSINVSSEMNFLHTHMHPYSSFLIAIANKPNECFPPIYKQNNGSSYVT